VAVYVDNVYIPAKVGNMRPAVWCHMTADTKDELHAFAVMLGMNTRWFQDKPNGLWHYDVTKTVRARAVRAGAIEITNTPEDFANIWHRPGREGVNA